MNFLSPWFLIGAAAIVGPIIFHLIRRAVKERITFSSLMFLRPTPPTVTRRRRLENPWLLLLRCLALLLLAAGFARPFFARDVPLPATSEQGRAILLLIDTSASMRREGVWDAAMRLTESRLAAAKPGDVLAISVFDQQARPVISFAEWSAWNPSERLALAQQRLRTVQPTWAGTQLGQALMTASESMADDSVRDRDLEIVLVTDLQEGARLDGLQGYDWPAQVRVKVERVSNRKSGNAGLSLVSNPNARGQNQEAVVVRVTNSRDSANEKFKLAWAGETTSAASEIYLPPGQSRVYPAPALPTNSTASRLILNGDAAPFDNTIFYARPVQENLRIAYFGDDQTDDPSQPGYYLSRVFVPTSRRRIEIAASTNNSEPSVLLQNAAFAVAARPLTDREGQALKNWLNAGGTGLLVLREAAMRASLENVLGANSGSITEAAADYALIGEINFQHPLFAPFADPKFSDFTRIHFWKHRRWEIESALNAEILAKFDDGSPFLAQLKVGAGQLLVMTAGWQPGDSQLAVSSKFPPLIQTMVDWGAGGAAKRNQFEVGDAISAPTVAGAGTIRWTTPEGTTQALRTDAAFADTKTPGIYEAEIAGQTYRFAVNLNADESRTAPRSIDDLAQLGVPMATERLSANNNAKQSEQLMRQTDLESRQKLWRWLIVAVLVFICGEILLSGWVNRRGQTLETAAP